MSKQMENSFPKKNSVFCGHHNSKPSLSIFLLQFRTFDYQFIKPKWMTEINLIYAGPLNFNGRGYYLDKTGDTMYICSLSMEWWDLHATN